jgi:histidine ammonia-lyase
MQEDHVSMGWAAAVKLRRVLDNLRSLLAVELLAAARGLQLRGPLRPSPAGRVAVEMVGRVAGPPGPDVFLAPVLSGVRDLIAGPDLRTAIEKSVGPLA